MTVAVVAIVILVEVVCGEDVSIVSIAIIMKVLSLRTEVKVALVVVVIAVLVVVVAVLIQCCVLAKHIISSYSSNE